MKVGQHWLNVRYGNIIVILVQKKTIQPNVIHWIEIYKPINAVAMEIYNN